jgi:acetoin utilization protein AcuB
MIADDLINHMIPPLKGTDDAHKAIVWMEEFRCTFLPVVETGQLLGFISEEIILEANDIDKEVKNFSLVGKASWVKRDTHFYDILRVASDNKVQMVAVLDDEGLYAGVITIQDTLASFAQTSAIQMPGSVLVLSMNHADYSLSNISRLIEENNAKILSSLVKEDPIESTRMRLILKVNILDLSRTVATLERFGYRVIGRYQETRTEPESKERLDMLFRYLNI